MKDYLIIGHGIAGAVLAQKLLDHKCQINVIDNSVTNCSSSVAGGLYNPITGRKMVKTWLADLLFPILEPTYEKLEKKLKSHFLHPIGIYRPFVSIEELNDWEGKTADKHFSSFVKSISKEPTHGISINDPYGGIHLNMSGFINVPELLKASKQYLSKSNSYEEASFIEEKLVIKDDYIGYGNTKYKKLIFCNGIKSLESPLFSWIPLRPAKGEVLTGVMKKKINTVYNRGVFILPKEGNTVRVGSNYQNHFEGLETTQAAQDEILGKLHKLIKEPVEISGAIAGIRPATKDRRPIIGKHPKYGHIYTFNGFGSKGVSLIPYFSEDFVAHLISGASIHQDVDIQRFYKLYNQN